jgi:hypothetical protein
MSIAAMRILTLPFLNGWWPAIPHSSACNRTSLRDLIGICNPRIDSASLATSNSLQAVRYAASGYASLPSPSTGDIFNLVVIAFGAAWS